MKVGINIQRPSPIGFDFIRECIKINKIRSFEKKFAIKMTQLVFVSCVLLSVHV